MLKEFLGTCSKFDISFDCRSCHSNYKTGRLKMRDWNYRHQTAGGGKSSYDTTALLLLISYTMQRFYSASELAMQSAVLAMIDSV